MSSPSLPPCYTPPSTSDVISDSTSDFYPDSTADSSSDDSTFTLTPAPTPAPVPYPAARNSTLPRSDLEAQRQCSGRHVSDFVARIVTFFFVVVAILIVTTPLSYVVETEPELATAAYLVVFIFAMIALVSAHCLVCWIKYVDTDLEIVWLCYAATDQRLLSSVMNRESPSDLVLAVHQQEEINWR